MNFVVVLAVLAAINSNAPIEFTPQTAQEIVFAYQTHYAIPHEAFFLTIKCESHFEPLAFNPSDPNGGSTGIAQFQKKTFYHYAPLAGIEHPNLKDPLQQIQTAAYMFSIGLGSQWTCFK